MDLKKKTKEAVRYFKFFLSYFFNYPFTPPKEVNFQMTNRCTLKCKMCNIWKLGKKGKEIEVEEMERILREIKENWKETEYVSFVGGESLIRMKDTLRLIKYANSLGFQTNLVSNGTLINEKICKKLIEAGLKRIALSLDGKEKTHDFIRGKGNFKKVINAAKLFLKERKITKTNVKVDFTTVIMSYNFRELPEIYFLAKEVGVDQWFLQALVLDNTFKNFNYSSPLWIKNDEIEELKEVIRKLITLKKNDKNFIYNSIDYLEAIPLYFEKKEKFRIGACMAGYYTLNIDPYGNISICNYGPNISVIGRSIVDAWKDKKFKRTRMLIKHCKNPCLMLCYQKFDVKELIRLLLNE